jgi:adenine C2-methylase RlmN of 23S rRNA A2503 and tRNA A37
MRAREYLSQAYRLDQRINSKLEQVQSLNELATKATSTLTGMPRNPNRATSTMADAVAKIIDLQAEINRDIDRLVDLKRDIVALVKSVDSTEFQTLLEKRYLCYMSWEQIAVDMNYSIHHL